MSINNQNTEPFNKSINMICESFNILKLEYETIINQLIEKISQKDFQIKTLKEKNTKYKDKIKYLIKRLKAITNTVKDIEVESEEEFDLNCLNKKKVDYKTVSNSFAPIIKKNSINNLNINNIKKSEFKLHKLNLINSRRNSKNFNDISSNIMSKTGGNQDDYSGCKKIEIKKNNRVLKNNKLTKGKIYSINIVNKEANSRSYPKSSKIKNYRNFDSLLEDDYFKFNTEFSESTKINPNLLSGYQNYTSFNSYEPDGNRTERNNRDYV